VNSSFQRGWSKGSANATTVVHSAAVGLPPAGHPRAGTMFTVNDTRPDRKPDDARMGRRISGCYQLRVNTGPVYFQLQALKIQD